MDLQEFQWLLLGDLTCMLVFGEQEISWICRSFLAIARRLNMYACVCSPWDDAVLACLFLGQLLQLEDPFRLQLIQRLV